MATFTGAELGRWQMAMSAARQVREAWEDCYARLQQSVAAGHQGKTTRNTLSLLEATAQSASQALAKAVAEEQRLAARYVTLTSGVLS